MRILITGSAGFLGFALASHYSALPQHQLFCVDNHLRGADDHAYKALRCRSNVTHLGLDLTDARQVAELPRDIDMVFHFAALNGTQNFYSQPFEVLKHTSLPAIHLIEHYRKSAIRRLIYASSSEVYASTVSRFGAAVPTGEDVALAIEDIANPRWSYAVAKIHGEAAVIHGCHAAGMGWSIIRYHNVYGPRMGDKHVIPDFLARARKGKFELHGAANTRAFIYVDDAVAATARIAASESCANQILNVGSDREVSMQQLAKLMMEIMGLRGDIVVHAAPAGSVARRVPDLSKLRGLVGFSEAWTLEAGLRQTIASYLSTGEAA